MIHPIGLIEAIATWFVLFSIFDMDTTMTVKIKNDDKNE